MTPNTLMTLALSNKHVINSYSLIGLIEDYSGGSIHLVGSHTWYIINRLKQQDYIKSEGRYFTITESGRHRLNQEIKILRYIYNSARYLAS